MSQTPEVRLMKEIQLWCGQHNFIAFHTNVGKIKFWDKTQNKERYFDSGLPPRLAGPYDSDRQRQGYLL